MVLQTENHSDSHMESRSFDPLDSQKRVYSSFDSVRDREHTRPVQNYHNTPPDTKKNMARREALEVAA